MQSELGDKVANKSIGGRARRWSRARRVRWGYGEVKREYPRDDARQSTLALQL